MFASFVTRNFKTFVEREQALNAMKLSKISLKFGYFTTLHHPSFAGWQHGFRQTPLFCYISKTIVLNPFLNTRFAKCHLIKVEILLEFSF